MEPRAVQRVNDRIRAEPHVLGCVNDFRRRFREKRKVRLRVRGFRLALREQHAHLHALLCRDTRNYKAIAAVIALACDDKQAFQRRNTRFQLFPRRASRVLHHLYVQQAGLVRRPLARLHFGRRHRFRHADSPVTAAGSCR